MSTTRERKARQRRNRINLIAIHAGIVLVGVATALYLLQVTFRAELDRQRAEYAHLAEGIAHRAESRLDAYRTLAENLSAFMDLEDGARATRFEVLAGVLSQNNPSIINVARSDGLVVTEVYPVGENQMVLGLDYRTRADQLVTIRETFASGEPIAFGPFDLVQGGKGLIVRDAAGNGSDVIYSVVLDLAAFLAEAGFDATSGDYMAALRPVSGRAAPGETLLGDPGLWQGNPVVKLIPVNGTDALEVALKPRDGWISRSPYAVETWAVISVLAMIGFFGVNYSRHLIRDRATARRQLMTAIESIQDGFVIFDQEDRLLFCNAKYRSYYQKTVDLLVPGTTFEQILRESVRRGQFAGARGREDDFIAERLAHHASPDNAPIEQRLADGRWLKVAESKTAEGYTVGFRVDITELKTALMKAEEISAAKTDFLNNMSHEFRTPLSVILGHIAFLRNAHVLPAYKALAQAVGDNRIARARLDDFVAAVSEQAARSDRSGQHLMGLINSVLDWSVLSNGNVDLALAEVNVDSMLSQLCSELQGKAHEKSLRLFYRGDVGVIEGDELRLRQVFINLVANAIKFTDRGYVRIDADGTPDHVTIMVEDTGPGIPKSHRELIFDRFAQVDGSSRRRHGGAGLGLSICKSLVELHGGTIEVASSEGMGSRFVVTLPRRRAVLPEGQEPAFVRAA